MYAKRKPAARGAGRASKTFASTAERPEDSQIAQRLQAGIDPAAADAASDDDRHFFERNPNVKERFRLPLSGEWPVEFTLVHVRQSIPGVRIRTPIVAIVVESPGHTLAHVVESDIGDVPGGRALFVTFELLSGPRRGEKLRERIDLVNEALAVQAVGQWRLSSLFHVTNTPPSRESADLHFKPVFIELSGNRIKKVTPAILHHVPDAASAGVLH